jgi:type III HopA1-like effector protein/LysM domain-containing protein
MALDPGSRLGGFSVVPKASPPPLLATKADTSFATMLDRNSTHSVGTTPATTTTAAKTNAAPKSPSPSDTNAAKPASSAQSAAPQKPVVPDRKAQALPTPVQQASTVKTAAENKLSQDQQTLKKLQGQLNDLNTAKPPTGLGAGRGSELAAAQNASRIGRLQAQIADTQKQMVTDQQAVTTGRSNLAAAQGAQATAANYRPSPPPVSAKDPVTKAVLPIVTAGRSKTSAAQARVDAATAALRQTGVQLDHLNTAMDRGVNLGMLKRLSYLQQQQKQQQAQLKADQHNLDAGKANLAAATSVVYSQQAAADRKTFSGAAAALKHTGVTIDPKTGGPKQKNLTTAQLSAYNRYITAQAKVEADAGMVGQSHAQLLSYASDKHKYGTIAHDAQSNVNKALRPLGFTTMPVAGIDPRAARANLDLANKASDYLNAGVDAANQHVAFNNAAHVDLNAIQPSDLKRLSPQAQQAAATANANYDQAAAYQGKVGAALDVTDKKQTLAAISAAYSKKPTADNKAALAQAQQQLQAAYAMSDIANASFLATSANVYANKQSIALVKLEQQGQVCVAPSTPLGQQITRAQAGVSSANLVANNLDANTGKLLADYNVSQQTGTVTVLQQALADADASGADPASPGFARLSGALTQAQQDLKTTQQQQALAQYQLTNSQFRLTVAANLLNPQTAADQEALSQAYESFFAKHPGALTDGQVAQQLAALKGPNEKMDIQQGLDELKQDASAERTALGDRSLLQKGADWTGGLFGANRSRLETTLKHDKAALQDLQGKKNQMSAQDFNAAYLKIMGNLGTQYSTMFKNERDTDSNWSTAQEVVRDVAIAGVATVVTIASAGTATPLVAIGLGTLAGVGTAEGIDTAQNASTVFSGGNVNDNSHISLDAAFSNNFFQGKDSWGELGHAGVDAAVDGVDSLGAAASVGAGSLAGDAATSLIARATSQAEDSALARIVSGSARMAANQGTMGAGNLTGTVIQTQYQVSQGSITQDQAQQQIGEAFKGYLKNIGVAAMTGGVTSAIDTGVMKFSGSETRALGLVSNPLYQTASNLGVNTVLTSPGVLTGKAPSAKSWLPIALNTLSAMAAHAATAEPPAAGSADRGSADPVVIDIASAHRGDLSDVVANVRGANAAYIPSDTPSPSVTVLNDSAFEQAYQNAGGRADPAQVNGFTKFGSRGAPPQITVRYNADSNAMKAVAAHEAVHAFTHPAFVKAAADAANTVVVNPDGSIKQLPTANTIEGVASHEAQNIVAGKQSNPEEAQIAAAIKHQMGSDPFDASDAFKKAVFGGDPAAIARFMQLAGEAGPSRGARSGAASYDLAASTTPQDPAGEQPQWQPSASDKALVVGGGHAFRTPQPGEVFLNIEPSARPDIVSDIKSTSIPDNHFSSVDFENVEHTLFRETPPRAFQESNRVLEPGGTINVVTGNEAFANRRIFNQVRQNLIDAGFANVRGTVSQDPETGQRIYRFTGTKPGTPFAPEASPESGPADLTSPNVAASATPQDRARRGLETFLQRIVAARRSSADAGSRDPSDFNDIYRLYNLPDQIQSFEGTPATQREKAAQSLTLLRRLIQERPTGDEDSISQNNSKPGLDRSASNAIQAILDANTAHEAKDFFHFLRAGADPDAVALRVYINANMNHAPEVMASVVKGIVDNPGEQFGGVYAAKIASPARAAGRNENIVIYVDSQDTLQNVLRELAVYHDSNPDHFMPDMPALTEPFKPGIATAAEPSPATVQAMNNALGKNETEYSFGESRALALHLAYMDAANASGNGTIDPATFAEKAAERFREFGIDPNDPSKSLPAAGGDRSPEASPPLQPAQTVSYDPQSASTQADAKDAATAPEAAGSQDLTQPAAKTAVPTNDATNQQPDQAAQAKQNQQPPELQRLQSAADEAFAKVAPAEQAAIKAQRMADVARRNAAKAEAALNLARARTKGKGLKQAQATATAAQKKAAEAQDAATAARDKVTRLQAAADQAQQDLVSAQSKTKNGASKPRIFGRWRADSKKNLAGWRNGEARQRFRQYFRPIKNVTKKSAVRTLKGVKVTLWGALAVNTAGLAAAGLFYFGVQSKRKTGKVTAQNALGQLAELEANPDKYMKDNYDYTLLGMRAASLDGLARKGDIDNGHLLEEPNPDGSPYYFRRVPEDLYNALKEVYAKKYPANSGKVFVQETIKDANGKPQSIRVEIRPPYRMEPLRDAHFTIQHEKKEKDKGFGFSYRINAAIGPIEGDRPNFSLELTLNRRYDLPTVTTLRAGLPTATQKLGVGVRQQNTTIADAFAAGGGTIDLNAAHVRDLTDKNSLLKGDEFQFFNVRPYIYLGNRNRVRADLDGTSPYVRARETGFAEPGIGIDFAKWTSPDKTSTGLNAYDEVQLYAPDFRAQFGNGSFFGLKPFPLPEVDTAVQLSTTKHQLPFASGVPLPRVIPNVAYADAGHPWEAASSPAATASPPPPALMLPPIPASGQNPPGTAPAPGNTAKPKPVTKPAQPDQYVVTPQAGLKVRSHPSLGGQKLGIISKGSFVVDSGVHPVRADGENWIEVTGRDTNGENVKGWIAQAFVAPHPRGAEGPTGRIDPVLRRSGDKTVQARRGDTLSKIAARHGISVAALEAENAPHIPYPDLIFPGDVIYVPTA